MYNANTATSSNNIHINEWLPSGEIGVVLFFFISGYIIAYPFLKDGKSTNVDLPRFYLRRLLRLWPEYALVLGACYLGLALSGYHPVDAPRFNAGKQSSLYSLLAGLAYLHGLVFDAANRLNPPMWSLEIEVQFYLIVPLILWPIRLLQQRMSLLLSIALCIGLTSLTELTGGIFPDTVQRWTIFKYLYLFLLGICFSNFALMSPPLGMIAKRRYDAGLFLGLLLLCAAGSLQSWMLFHQYYPLYLRICCNAAYIMAISLIYFGAMLGVVGRRVAALPWISVTGGMCYSIYLVHDPLMQGLAEILKHVIPRVSLGIYILTCYVALVPAALLTGAILFVVVERPLMNPNSIKSLYNVVRASSTRMEQPK